MSKPPPPESESHQRVNWLGLLGMVGATWAVVRYRLDAELAIPLLVLSAALPILLADVLVYKVHRKASTGLDWTGAQPRSWERISVKLVGWVAVLAVVGGTYTFLPEYAGEWYADFFTILLVWMPWVAAIGAAYFAWLDGHLVEPRDAYWHVGALVTGRREEVDLAQVGGLFRGWAVKGFFIPVMYCFMLGALDDLHATAARGAPGEILTTFVGVTDLAFAIGGYILSLKIVDTHLRSAEPTVSGWVAALLCYPPFNRELTPMFAPADTGHQWTDILVPDSGIGLGWRVTLATTAIVFAWATVSFGMRFSNLTHRGVVTDGPYRFSKHPAYLSKLMGFWMIHLPFVPSGGLRNTIGNLVRHILIALLYYWRARTEEAHMSRDPRYVEYALWMNEHGLLARLSRWLPWLRYVPPDRHDSTRE